MARLPQGQPALLVAGAAILPATPVARLPAGGYKTGPASSLRLAPWPAPGPVGMGAGSAATGAAGVSVRGTGSFLSGGALGAVDLQRAAHGPVQARRRRALPRPRDRTPARRLGRSALAEHVHPGVGPGGGAVGAPAPGELAPGRIDAPSSSNQLVLQHGEVMRQLSKLTKATELSVLPQRGADHDPSQDRSTRANLRTYLGARSCTRRRSRRTTPAFRRQ